MVGLAFVSKAGWNIYQYRQFQNHLFSNRLPVEASAFHKNLQSAPGKHVAIGKLSVPRLQLSVAMVEGDSDESLSLAVGHMTGTAPVGSKGNAVVAGHRDTVFWPLRNIKVGDHIVVSTDKKYVYAVEQTQIVDPEDTRALQDAQNATLTMVTCYPFRHVGPSPKRFIVTAKLLRVQS